jgi:hypothetical protein
MWWFCFRFRKYYTSKQIMRFQRIVGTRPLLLYRTTAAILLKTRPNTKSANYLFRFSYVSLTKVYAKDGQEKRLNYSAIELHPQPLYFFAPHRFLFYTDQTKKHVSISWPFYSWTSFAKQFYLVEDSSAWTVYAEKLCWRN